MATSQVEGYVKERQNDFFGKDGMQWWIGEVEDNQDPLQINRVKVRMVVLWRHYQQMICHGR
jgi:hypothetical protein